MIYVIIEQEEVGGILIMDNDVNDRVCDVVNDRGDNRVRGIYGLKKYERTQRKVVEGVTASVEALRKLGLKSVDLEWSDGGRICYILFNVDDLINVIGSLVMKRVKEKVESGLSIVCVRERDYVVLRIEKKSR